MTTPWLLSRIGISVKAAVIALGNPSRQDMVAALGETTGLAALAKIRDNMLMDTQGRRILRLRPIIHSSTINLPRLASLPHNTFGFAYHRFLELNSISPDTRLDVRYIGDPELAYVMARYRQVHDFWHTLVELPITVEAEIGLKLFEFFQTRLPMTLLSVMFGPLNITSEQRKILFSTYLPWSIQCANSSRYLMNVMYEDLLDLPLVQVQAQLRIVPVPKLI